MTSLATQNRWILHLGLDVAVTYLMTSSVPDIVVLSKGSQAMAWRYQFELDLHQIKIIQQLRVGFVYRSTILLVMIVYKMTVM